MVNREDRKQAGENRKDWKHAGKIGNTGSRQGK
jgi:hypothetical protein